MSDPGWERAALALRLLAVDPAGLGGVHLRARAGPVRAVWLWLSPSSFEHMRAWVEASLSVFLWNNLVSPLLGLPFALVLALASALFFWLGRPPASRIGYVSHL